MSRAKHHTREERALILSTIDEGRRLGRPLKELIAEQGISEVTYYSWRRGEKRVAFRSVSVTATQTVSTGPVLVTPSGYRVEGLAMAEMAQLLRFLG